MPKQYKIKAFSELTGVTVRTLHHYDHIGLLKPKHKSEGGYRLYSELDLLRLQQILTLKFLGLPLNHIQEMMDAEHLQLIDALKLQSNALDKRADEIKMASRLIKQMLMKLKTNESIQWSEHLQLIKVMKMKDQDIICLYKEYFSGDEYAALEKIWGQFDAGFKEDYDARWAELMAECALNKNEDPQGKVGEDIGQRGWGLIIEVYGDNLGLGKKLWDATLSGAIPMRSEVSVDSATLEFFDKAVMNYAQKLKK